MSQLYLNGSLRTCKVDQGWASRIQSDRFENPDLLVCPVWSGFDLTNRAVCVDSFYTKSPGCNSPLDRVDVENYLRPQYMEYINLDAEGFRHNQDIKVGRPSGNTESCTDPNANIDCYNSAVRTIGIQQLPKITGNFGLSPSGAQIEPRCGNYSCNRAEAQINQQHRQLESVQHATQSQSMRQLSGM